MPTRVLGVMALAIVITGLAAFPSSAVDSLGQVTVCVLAGQVYPVWMLATPEMVESRVRRVSATLSPLR
jgi:hypothetical protein